ncbi:type II toxin-antitoxin system Phd/YefM family antitoxin [Streptosporangium sp. NPDC003464]
MKTITQREFRNNSAAVMDAAEAGEVYHITRNGIEVAELRPLARRRRPSGRARALMSGETVGGRGA